MGFHGLLRRIRAYRHLYGHLFFWLSSLEPSRKKRSKSPRYRALFLSTFLPGPDHQMSIGIRGCRGADAPSPHAGVYGKGGLLEGSPHCFTPLELYFTRKRSLPPNGRGQEKVPSKLTGGYYEVVIPFKVRSIATPARPYGNPKPWCHWRHCRAG